RASTKATGSLASGPTSHAATLPRWSLPRDKAPWAIHALALTSALRSRPFGSPRPFTFRRRYPGPSPRARYPETDPLSRAFAGQKPRPAVGPPPDQAECQSHVSPYLRSQGRLRFGLRDGGEAAPAPPGRQSPYRRHRRGPVAGLLE